MRPAAHPLIPLAIGGLIAAVWGASAGAALRPQAHEQLAPAAPQQIWLQPVELAALERAGGGWPARPHVKPRA